MESYAYGGQLITYGGINMADRPSTTLLCKPLLS